MGTPKILWLAVDEARGHLMRAHLARKTLASAGVTVDIATTSLVGHAFLEALGSPARVLRGRYRLAYDPSHNLQARRSARNIRRYGVSPRGLVLDLADLHSLSRRYSLIVDDSFHPALIVGAASPQIRHRLVRVYGQHLPTAVEASIRGHSGHGGASLARAFRRAHLGAFAHVEHTLDPRRTSDPDRRVFRLPPLIATPRRARAQLRADIGVPAGAPLAVLYLNPRFSDLRLAAALVDGLRARGLFVHGVAESLPASHGWGRPDPHLIDAVAAADVLIAGAGMGTLGHVAAFGIPFVALASRQPEQTRNLRELARFPGAHAVLDVGERATLRQRLDGALDRTLCRPHVPTHPCFAPWRAQSAWIETFARLVDSVAA